MATINPIAFQPKGDAYGLQGRLVRTTLDHTKSSPIYETGIRPNHSPMGHVITPPQLIEAQGFAQMETYIPIRLRQPG